MVASCASAIAWTMERPRPRPLAPLVRVVSSRWNGWKSRSSSLGGIFGPVFATVRTALTVAGLCREADAAAVDVVVDGVAEEVGDEPLDQARVAGRLRRFERGVEDEPVVVRGGRRGSGDGGEVDGLTAVEAALAAGEREERFDQAFLLLADGEELLARVPVGVDAGVRVAERELEQGALERERGAQLVRGVGDELSLRLEGGLEAGEQSVDGAAELLELVVGSRRGRVGGGGCWRRCRGRCR